MASRTDQTIPLTNLSAQAGIAPPNIRARTASIAMVTFRKVSPPSDLRYIGLQYGPQEERLPCPWAIEQSGDCIHATSVDDRVWLRASRPLKL
jgi:hypothetical protein